MIENEMAAVRVTGTTARDLEKPCDEFTGKSRLHSTVPDPRFSGESVARVKAFDVDAFIHDGQVEAAKLTPEERQRHREDLEKARFDAAEYALRSDDPDLRELARVFLVGPEGRAA
jgi:hypothetical protein